MAFERSDALNPLIYKMNLGAAPFWADATHADQRVLLWLGFFDYGEIHPLGLPGCPQCTGQVGIGNGIVADSFG